MSAVGKRTGHLSTAQAAPAQGAEDETRAVVLRAASHADDIGEFDIRHLRYFLAVVRAGTVSAAAQELRISQPSLSQQIRRLERRVGAPLFIRNSRGVELTSGGSAFLREIQGIPGQLRSAIEAAALTPRTWSVGVCGGVPAEVLAEVQNGLTNPGVESDGQVAPRLPMRSVSTAHQMGLFQQGEIVFGIVRLPVDTPQLVLAVVRDEPLGVVMQSGHPLAGQAALGWADLAAQRLLWYDAGCAPGYAESVPVQLAALGWNPALHPIDQDQQNLFVHALQTTADLVALRPRTDVQKDPRLVWRPLPTPRAPRERLAVTAMAGSRAAHVLSCAATRCGWHFLP